MKKIFYSIVLAAATLILPQSCSEDFLEVQPTSSIAAGSVFTTTDNAWSALNGIHRLMFSQFGSGRMDEAGQSGMMLHLENMSDDLVNHGRGNGWFIAPASWLAHTNENSVLPYFGYRLYYRIISNANMIIHGIDEATGPEADKKAIKGQALAYRGWAHFNLVRLFGERYDWTATPNSQPGVPLMLDNTFEGAPRASVEEVYAQIRLDLDEAISLLADMGSRAKSHISQDVAKGIRARVALTTGEWDKAATMANEARDGWNLMSHDQLFEGFSHVSNPEFMWASEVVTDQTTYFHSFFAFASYNFSSTKIRGNPYKINNLLYDMMSETDARRILWNDTLVYPIERTYDEEGELESMVWTHPKLEDHPTKFTKAHLQSVKFEARGQSDSRGDVPYMRTAEMILVEAEALARDGKDALAQDVLFELASARDDEYEKSTSTDQDLIDEILIQRRIELWGEGFRFYDLKRTNSDLDRRGANHVFSVLSNLDYVAAGDPRWQWKIPRAELDANPSLTEADQN